MSQSAAAGEPPRLAIGLNAALWPKVDKCQDYVAELLAAQEQLQHTIDALVAGLKEAEKAGDAKYSLVGYAERLRGFPTRVTKLQKKLEVIEDRLLAMKQARDRGASCVAKFDAPAVVPADPAPFAASPLF